MLLHDITDLEAVQVLQDERDELRAALEALDGDIVERRAYLERHGVYYDHVLDQQCAHETLEETYARMIVRCALKGGNGFSWRDHALALEACLAQEPRQDSGLPIAVGELAHLQERVEEMEKAPQIDALVKA